ncbi:hypothetical protein SCA6_010859, partial [Theobroma cacao]
SKSPSIDGYGVPSKESKDQGCTFVFYGYGDPSKEFQRINSPRSKECITNAHNSETGTSHLNNHGYGLPSKEFKGKNGGKMYSLGGKQDTFVDSNLNRELKLDNTAINETIYFFQKDLRPGKMIWVFQNLEKISSCYQLSLEKKQKTHSLLFVRECKTWEKRSLFATRLKYPRAVYLCHAIHKTEVYKVPLVGIDGTKADAVAVCHKDISGWNPMHSALQILKEFLHPSTKEMLKDLKERIQLAGFERRVVNNRIKIGYAKNTVPPI